MWSTVGTAHGDLLERLDYDHAIRKISNGEHNKTVLQRI